MRLAQAEPNDDDIEDDAAPGDKSVGEVTLRGAVDSEEAGANRPVPEPERLRLWPMPVVNHERDRRETRRCHVGPQRFLSTPIEPEDDGNTSEHQCHGFHPTPLPRVFAERDGEHDTERSKAPAKLQVRLFVTGTVRQHQTEHIKEERHAPGRDILRQTLLVYRPSEIRRDDKPENSAQENG